MIKRNFKLFCLLLCMMFLVSCGATNLNYQDRFPKDSPGLQAFMETVVTTGYNEIRSDGNTHIATKKNMKKKKGKISYVQYTDNELKNFYKSIEDNPKSVFNKLKLFDIRKRELFQSVEDNSLYRLPTITTMGDGDIHVKTEENEKTIHLKDYDIGNSFIVNILNTNETGFVLALEDVEKAGDMREIYYLFASNDLDNIQVTQMNPENTRKVIKSGKLKDYYSLFMSLGDNNKFLFDETHVLNTKTNQLIELQEEDRISKDGKYVYLDGDEDSLSDGVQRIQAIEDYITGNHNYDTEFKLSYKKIAKELGFKTSGVSIATVMYFNQDYIVLRLTYNGRIVGKAGATNVLIDLQDKENPTAYLVDLDWL